MIKVNGLMWGWVERNSERGQEERINHAVYLNSSSWVIMFSAAVSFFQSLEDGAAAAVILSSSCFSPSWFLWSSVPGFSWRIYHLRWKATGSEAVSLRAGGNKSKAFPSSKQAAAENRAAQSAGLLEIQLDVFHRANVFYIRTNHLTFIIQSN